MCVNIEDVKQTKSISKFQNKQTEKNQNPLHLTSEKS